MFSINLSDYATIARAGGSLSFEHSLRLRIPQWGTNAPHREFTKLKSPLLHHEGRKMNAELVRR
jgi:hypothetical protein